MKVQEYRDLISQVVTQFASARSAVGDYEQDCECRRLIRNIEELEAAVCPRATPRDRQRAESIAKQAGQHTFTVLMGLYDNQRLEETYGR